MYRLSHILSALCLSLVPISLSAQLQQLHIIPEPQSITTRSGQFELTPATVFVAKGKGAGQVADFFARKLRQSTGYPLPAAAKGKHSVISLAISKRVTGQEAYTLSVTSKGVKAEAATPQGLYYAMQTFMQLLPPQVESKHVVNARHWTAPAVEIKDAPRFAYRGALIDVCRHFFPVEQIKHQIDVLSMYKINNLHFHLTEDQGWRMEIKKYPELTKVGAWRTDDFGQRYGGYYTQDELRDIVKYAQERFVNIVPELEMPGHELAAISAYPWLSCRNVKTTPRPVWGVEDIVMCPGKETTFRFLEDVIDEMVEIFPSPYYHIGGDESPRVEWAKCPLCQKRADELGLKAEKGRSREAQLQSYIVGRMEKYLNQKGKSIIGWDEILEGGNLNKTATVMSWRGQRGGIAAAKAGHRVIMTPSRDGMYLDYFQGDPLIEPFGIGGLNTLQKTYNYDPIPEEIRKAGAAPYVWGPQGNLWAEFIDSNAKQDYRLYPRILAIAETGWTLQEKKNFSDFQRRLDTDASVRLDLNEVNYHIPLPEQEGGSCDYIAFADTQTVAFKTTRPERMVYTLDGTMPTPESATYDKPFHFNSSQLLKIATVLPTGKMSRVRTIHIERQIPSPAVPMAAGQTPKPGLSVKLAWGTYKYTEELAAVEQWQHKTIAKLSELNELTEVSKNRRNIRNYAAIAEGLIDVPQDGAYYFQANFPEVWIDGRKVVDNNHEPISHHYAGGRSIVLKAGKHRLQIYFLGHTVDGYSSYGSATDNLKYRLGAVGSFSNVDDAWLSQL